MVTSIQALVDGGIEDVIVLRSRASSRTKGSENSKAPALAAGHLFLESHSIPNGQ